MNREETLTLMRQGKSAWNAWAESMTADRQRLQTEGTWAADVEIFGGLEPGNDATSAWLNAASAQFSTAREPLQFEETADFSGWIFPGTAIFDGATFADGAGFSRTIFMGDASFNNATFINRAGFEHALFTGSARFNNATFKGDARFDNATFNGVARFGQATFEAYARFSDVIFRKAPEFPAMKSERAFSLADAIFCGVPDFIQAHFAEAPRLDDTTFHPRFHWRTTRADGRAKSAPARWRALKRIAIQGHDHEREQEFFAREIASQRFVTDFPLTWRLWSGAAWGGVARWWFGLLYQIVSNFGRSLARPFVFWIATIVVSTLYYLGQTPVVVDRTPSSLAIYASESFNAWWRDEPCVSRNISTSDARTVLVSGLAAPVRAQTSAANEALHLALRNAFIVLDGGQDAAHRTFGCLYGVERYGDNPIAIVPSNVSFASALQKLLSAILIFLFGLALRNMLRMK